MAAILIIKSAVNSFEIQVFRTDEELDRTLLQFSDESVFHMKNISRNSIQQIERFFRRMLTEDYFGKLKKEPDEEMRIRRLYEIGARR